MSVSCELPEDPGHRVKDLARLLRGVGAAVLLAAASTFLLQHWNDTGDIPRYLGLLGLSAMLAGAGLLVGVGMKESRSARTLLALAAATVPAHFAIVGGLLYSQWALPGSGLPTARYAIWQASSAAMASAVAALSLVVLVPIVQLAFTALARPRARVATALFFATGVLMWIPTRDPYWATLMIGAACAALAVFEFRSLRPTQGLRTVEGVLLRLVLATPPALLAARSVLHYELTWFLPAVLCAASMCAATALATEARVPRAWRRVSEAVALLAGVATCVSVALGVDQIWPLRESALLLALGLPFATGLATLASLVPDRRSLYGNSAGWVALGTVSLDLALFSGESSTLIALIVGVLALADGFLRHRTLLCAAGGATAALALCIQVLRAAAHYSWSAWGALALIGIVVIVAAALLDRHHAALRRGASALRTRFAAWEY